MKTAEFKKIIKEAFREVFYEEMKEILLEAVKSSKNVIHENRNSENISNKQVINNTSVDDFRTKLRNQMLGSDDINLSTNNINTQQYNPPPVYTVGEGSTLPPGEVGLDQIMNLLK